MCSQDTNFHDSRAKEVHKASVVILTHASFAQKGTLLSVKYFCKHSYSIKTRFDKINGVKFEQGAYFEPTNKMVTDLLQHDNCVTSQCIELSRRDWQTSKVSYILVEYK